MSAAIVALVGMYVSPLMASAERWMGSRQRWSGIRALPSQLRQNDGPGKPCLGVLNLLRAGQRLGPRQRAIRFLACRQRVPCPHPTPLDSEREIRSEANRPSGALASAECRSPSTSVHSPPCGRSRTSAHR